MEDVAHGSMLTVNDKNISLCAMPGNVKPRAGQSDDGNGCWMIEFSGPHGSFRELVFYSPQFYDL